MSSRSATAAHGTASLLIAKPLLPWGDRLEFANRVLCAAAMGHAVSELLGNDRTPAAARNWLAAHVDRANAPRRP